jgi:hypothetical protein
MQAFGMYIDNSHFNLAPFCGFWKSRINTTL